MRVLYVCMTSSVQTLDSCVEQDQKKKGVKGKQDERMRPPLYVDMSATFDIQQGFFWE